MTEWQKMIDHWNADQVRMAEFIEKIIVHEGSGRGKQRRQRLDFYFNFIGAFEVPADIVTPMEQEAERRQQEEQTEKEEYSKVLAQARYEKRKQERREFTARKRAGLLTTEEQVEAQNDFYPGYPLIKRGIYYCCRMISSQYGREFTGPHYEKIKKVYSIWICMKPPQYRENTITRYRLVEEHLVGEGKEPVRNYDLLSIIMLCLGGPNGANYDGVLRMLDVLLSNETSEAEKRKILQDDYDIQMTQTMEREVSVMCNLSKGVEEKGIAKGHAERALSDLRNLMETLGLTIEQAMAALKVPEGERQKYMDLLERQ
ncbi:DUF4368 domain-containing protein [Pseudoflavonifractor sp. 524-17]|uniref:DUF4368 domain-containing protein n=1 Tax=Pseudoflavonifractor sp. 524-17 TaxID=2304577 RepID=UPI00137B4537|nr:DUF4368 domain-containing protein [Pseudoflavonifractor sp. 524-17]NCE65611.1 DUF4368 domain-containing protein [Pseudoflavonifractor sp. 524-17]